MEEKELKKEIEKDLKILLVAYNVDTNKDIMQKWINIIYSSINYYRKLNKKLLQDVLKHILENYNIYRTVNAAVYLTAFKKVLTNQNPF